MREAFLRLPGAGPIQVGKQLGRWWKARCKGPEAGPCVSGGGKALCALLGQNA